MRRKMEIKRPQTVKKVLFILENQQIGAEQHHITGHKQTRFWLE